MDFIIQLLDILSSMKKFPLKGSYPHIMRVIASCLKLAMSSGIQNLI